MFTLQTGAIIDNLRDNLAADLVVFATRIDAPLPEDPIREYMEQELHNKADKVLLSYSYVSYPMWAIDDIKANWVSNLAEYPWRRLSLFGVERDFLDTIFSEVPSSMGCSSHGCYHETHMTCIG